MYHQAFVSTQAFPCASFCSRWKHPSWTEHGCSRRVFRVQAFRVRVFRVQRRLLPGIEDRCSVYDQTPTGLKARALRHCQCATTSQLISKLRSAFVRDRGALLCLAGVAIVSAAVAPTCSYQGVFPGLREGRIAVNMSMQLTKQPASLLRFVVLRCVKSGRNR